MTFGHSSSKNRKWKHCFWLFTWRVYLEKTCEMGQKEYQQEHFHSIIDNSFFHFGLKIIKVCQIILDFSMR